MAAFAYPRGTLENPTVSCPVGFIPIVPDGFKFGTLAYYEASFKRPTTNGGSLIDEIIRSDIGETAHYIGTLRTANESNGDVASIATTYLSFDNFDTESGESVSDFQIDEF
ncbi:hypothetical protein J3R30DRAFT_3407835 [Lentinula aciculospora]|uniref:Uncharacterized protein n=1 Tax=Lentinula aciculospora TaxID=153920 RepID=A0A9W9DHW9_9AGAR|nr:hypothetical protein J3R30DRAFT_3407835 [Lentinula aciculospora]